MATKKKTSTTKSTAKSAAPKKAAPKKTAAKKPKLTKSNPAGPREKKIADSALKLVDEAAALLRKGIRESASTTEKSRHDAKRKAHSLLSKASSSLEGLLSGGTSAVRSVINKI